MALPRFAVVDLETSGLRADRHRILQVAMVVVDADGTVHDEWETYVKLRWPLSRVGPTEVHGITRSTLRGAPRLGAVVDEVTGRLAGHLFVAHNAGFDGEFLRRAVHGRPGADAADLERRLCTLRMSRRLDPDRERSHRLADVCDRYGVGFDNPHDALSDARATAAVLPHLLSEHSVEDEGDLDPFLDRVDPRPRRRGVRRRAR